jgi:hypothetical protein
VIQPIFKLGTLLPKYMYISLAPDKWPTFERPGILPSRVCNFGREHFPHTCVALSRELSRGELFWCPATGMVLLWLHYKQATVLGGGGKGSLGDGVNN